MGLLSLFDFVFPLAGVGLTLWALLRPERRETTFLLRELPGVRPAEAPPPPASIKELLATALALLCAAVGPNVLIVATTPGMPDMRSLGKYALVPSIVLLGLVYAYARWQGLDRLTNRIWTGAWTGFVATGTLDVVRLTGFGLGWMPGDMPRMFGVMLLGTMAQGPTPLSDLVGYLYHFWVGACFGLVLTLVVGKARWWAGLVWALIIEVGMMTTPPMVIAMDTGFFGWKFGPGLFGVSLTAHVVYGVFLGLLAQKYVRHRGSLWGLVREVRMGLSSGEA